MRKQSRERIYLGWWLSQRIYSFLFGSSHHPIFIRPLRGRTRPRRGKTQYLDSNRENFINILIFLYISNRFFYNFFTNLDTKNCLVCNFAPNRLYENGPKATSAGRFKKASEKIKKNFFLMMRIISKYCILC